MRYGKSINNWSKDEIKDIIEFYTATTADSQLFSISSEKFCEKNNK